MDFRICLFIYLHITNNEALSCFGRIKSVNSQSSPEQCVGGLVSYTSLLYTSNKDTNYTSSISIINVFIMKIQNTIRSYDNCTLQY